MKYKIPETDKLIFCIFFLKKEIKRDENDIKGIQYRIEFLKTKKGIEWFNNRDINLYWNGINDYPNVDEFWDIEFEIKKYEIEIANLKKKPDNTEKYELLIENMTKEFQRLKKEER